MLNRLSSRWHRWQFEQAVRGIDETPPLGRGQAAYTALSMVQHRDVLPYLLALKSLARFLPPADVVVVADPTLNADDRARMREHVPHIEIREAAEFRHRLLPVGGTWERLAAIAERVGRSQVVQLDADTVTLAMPTEVRDSISAGLSFTLGTDDDQMILATRDAASVARQTASESSHIQARCEALLDRLDPDNALKYVRGCSGFAGFGERSFSLEHLIDVSARMKALVGDDWSKWGTEQFTSNLMVASSPSASILPHPRYCAPHRRTVDTVFLHFIGYVRYVSGYYAAVARRTIAQLKE